MDDYNHTDLLLLQSAELTERTQFCPEDQVIAAFFDGELPGEAKASLNRHISDCGFCQTRIGLMYRLQGNCDGPKVSEDTLAVAKKLHQAPPKNPVKKATTWATAAVLVLAMLSVVNINQHPEQNTAAETSAITPAVDGYRQLRSVDRNTSPLRVQIDSPTDVVRPGTRIHWSEIQGNIHYTIQLLSASGDIVWTERSEKPEWIVQDSIHLTADSPYFLRIEAALSNGETISSRHISFKTAHWK